MSATPVMSRLEGVAAVAAAFADAAAQGRAALIPFLAAGDPDPDRFLDLALAAAAAGSDLLEIGLPFPDSLADGPVIQAAYERAIASGMHTGRVLQCVARIAAATTIPIVLMTAYNPVFVRGVDRFVGEAHDAGIAALLVPDLPFEDKAGLQAHASAAGLALPLLVGPDTPAARAAAIARAASGFVYLVRRPGVTGVGSRGTAGPDRVRALRTGTSTPVAVGFGIATEADVAAAAADADGVIVGSALVDLVARDPAAAAQAVGERIRILRRATRRPDSTDLHEGARA